MTLEPEKEFEGLYRTHVLDNAKFIAWLKKTIKSKTIRVNKYIISPLIDGKMLQVEVEKFIKIKDKDTGRMVSRSAGTRTVKGYLSEEKSTELVGLLDGINRTEYQDMRTKEPRIRPEKIERGKSIIKKLDLDNLFAE